MTQQPTIAIVGGGLAGLAAAVYLGRSGHAVRVYEKAPLLGGRAATHAEGDFRFNMGPHALYRGGAAARVLRELGVSYTGRSPSASGGYAVHGATKHTLPGGFVSLLTTGLLPLAGKLETARLLASVHKIDVSPIVGTSVRQWLNSTIRNTTVRQLIEALIRLTSYANDPERQSAGAAIAQLQLALASNVMYLDGGWQVLVDALRAAAQDVGVQIVTRSRIVAIEHTAAVRGVRLADGSIGEAAAVIVATSPAEALALFADDAAKDLRRWAAASTPVKAACLDVAMRRLPKPRAVFALGVDRPLYLSVHSAAAKLAPEGAATIQVAKYLGNTQPQDAKSDERELEGLLDLMQPGWREQVVHRRFLPNMVVSHALVTADGGAAGRPDCALADIQGLYLAGDWVGREGMLADASLASAKEAAERVARVQRVRPAAAA